MKQHIDQIAGETQLTAHQVAAVAQLLSQSATIPFIARYRKEATGSLDEVAVTAIRDRLARLKALDERREAILSSLRERELLTGDLKKKIMGAETLAALEDIYLPLRPRRRTRALIAKEKGLEPLADHLCEQNETDPHAAAQGFIDSGKGVGTADDALQGARDIIAERISEDPRARSRMRMLFMHKGVIQSKVHSGKEEEAGKYKDYFDWQEQAHAAPSHRVLAIRRAEKEGFLALRILPDQDEAIAILEKMYVRQQNKAAEQVRAAVRDSYHRLLGPSMETEARLELKQRADAEAIRVFAANLRQLLLAPPLGRRRVMALDPGFRTGCKVVCLDSGGALLHHGTVYPHEPHNKKRAAAQILEQLCRQYAPDVIAVGNGTAGRETEQFIRMLKLSGAPAVTMVSESGASVYSASAAAREEFPDHDVTVRGAVSIGRRLMDPLAELVKIDPKSIGVGQYQHDVDQKLLKSTLDDCVASCVNLVGVDVNTASRQLLSYVSGVGPSLAQRIVEHRTAYGPFNSREELRSVSGLGPKAFEQAAGFLRITQGANPLDASAVHPESYHIVEHMARDLGCSVGELLENETLRSSIDLKQYTTEAAGLPTLQDIMSELAKPGRDPREQFEVFSFAEGVNDISDVTAGMRLPGIVTNITNFGAFVDIGVHQDGLVHISELADRYVKNPADEVRLHQKVTVRVLDVDVPRKRISLSLRSPANTAGAA